MGLEQNGFKSPAFSCETTMNQLEVDFLISKLKKSRNYLEYGSGFSTIEAGKYVKEKIFSVETNLDYVHFMNSKLEQEGIASSKITFLHSHVGDTGDWGYPINTKAIAEWPSYGSLHDETLSLSKFTPDLSLIDGRFRIATFARLYLSFPGLEIIFDDYNDRPRYQIVESFLQPKCLVGRIAFFKVPKFRQNFKVKLAIDIMLDNLLMPY